MSRSDPFRNTFHRSLYAYQYRSAIRIQLNTPRFYSVLSLRMTKIQTMTLMASSKHCPLHAIATVVGLVPSREGTLPL